MQPLTAIKTSVFSGSKFREISFSAVHTTGTKILRTEFAKANQFLPSMLFLHSKCTLTSQASHPKNMFQEADTELSNCLPETTPSRQA